MRTFGNDLARNLTKREHFAGQALIGLVGTTFTNNAAYLAVEAADALIAALDKGSETCSKPTPKPKLSQRGVI